METVFEGLKIKLLFLLLLLFLTVFENHRKSLIQRSEASYVYILSEQKLIKNAKNSPFWRLFENLKFAFK